MALFVPLANLLALLAIVFGVGDDTSSTRWRIPSSLALMLSCPISTTSPYRLSPVLSPVPFDALPSFLIL